MVLYCVCVCVEESQKSGIIIIYQKAIVSECLSAPRVNKDKFC